MIKFILCLLACPLGFSGLAFAEQDIARLRANINSVESVRLDCKDEGPEIMGKRNCKGLTKQIEDRLAYNLSMQVAGFYKGIDLNFATGASKLAAVPVCNSGQGELKKNWLSKSSGCGSYCGMKIETGWFSGSMKVDDKNGHCDWEYGQYRGAFVQALNYCADRVMTKFHAHSPVPTISIDGVKPNAELAIDIIDYQQQATSELEKIVKRHGSVEKAAATNCPYIKNGRVKRATTDDLKKMQGDAVSQGACAMNMVQLDLASMWTSFLHGEIVWCAMKEFDDQFATMDRWVDDVKNSVGKRCEAAAKCDVDLSTFKRVMKVSGDTEAYWDRWSCSDNARTKLFGDCYNREVPPYVRSRIDRFRSNYKIKLPPVPPPKSAGLTNLFFSFGLIVPFGRRKKKPSKKKTFLSLLTLAIFAFAVSGCDCDENDVSCKPCGTPPGQQAKGCVYKGCLDLMYVCVKKSDSKVLNTNVAAIDNTEDNATNWDDGTTYKDDDYFCYTAQNPKDLTALKKLQDPCFREHVMELSILGLDPSQSYPTPLACGMPGNTSLQSLGLKRVELDDARKNCRALSGMNTDLDDHDNYEDAATEVGHSQMWDEATMAALENAIGRVGGSDQACSTDLDGVVTPPISVAPVASNANNSLQDLRSLSGDSPIAEVAPKKDNGDIASNNAEAGGVRDKSGLPKPNFNPKAAPNGGLTAPQFKTGSGGGAGSGSGVSAGLGLAGGGTGDAAKVAEGAVLAGTKEEDTKYESGKGGDGGKPQKAANPFNMFGGEEGASGPGGVTSASFGTGSAEGTPADFESYLQKMSKVSLFEVVNKRMDKWGRQ